MFHYASVVILTTHILVLLPSAIPLSLHSICYSTLSASNTSSFLSVTNQANSCFTFGCLSFHTFSLGICILFFFLGAELMTTSPTSNRCCDTHSSPEMTLTFFYMSSVTSSQQQVINCTHCTTRYTGGQFVLLSLETSVRNNQFHCITELQYLLIISISLSKAISRYRRPVPRPRLTQLN